MTSKGGVIYVALFVIFENRYYATNQVYFYESNSKNWPRTRSKVSFFYLSNLKDSYFFLKICKYLQSPRRAFNIKFFFLCLGPQNGQTDLFTGKQICFTFSSCSFVHKPKGDIPPGAGLKKGL